MSWEVLVIPKRKNDVHGVAVILKATDAPRYGDAVIELARVSIFRRPDTAARHKESFDKVLMDLIADAEKAAHVMGKLDLKYDEVRRKAQEEARAEIAKIFPPAKAGAPEFE